jgi:hypothetical protein
VGADECDEAVAACNQTPESCRGGTPPTGKAEKAGGRAANLVRCCKGLCDMLPLAVGFATSGAGHQVCYTWWSGFATAGGSVCSLRWPGLQRSTTALAPYGDQV